MVCTLLFQTLHVAFETTVAVYWTHSFYQTLLKTRLKVFRAPSLSWLGSNLSSLQRAGGEKAGGEKASIRAHHD